MSDSPSNNLFNCLLATHTKTYYQDLVNEVLLPGEQGQFGVLANHESAIIALTYGITLINSPQGSEKLFISKGFAHINNNELCILVEQVIEISKLLNAPIVDEQARLLKHDIIIDLSNTTAVNINFDYHKSLIINCPQLQAEHDNWLKISFKLLTKLGIKTTELLGAMITSIHDVNDGLLKFNSVLQTEITQQALYLKIPVSYLNIISNTKIYLHLIYNTNH